MITQAPLLDRALLARARLPATTDQALIRPWRRPGDEARLIDRSAHGLAALAQAVAGRLGRPPRIAVPAWICNQSLEPLRATGAGLTYLPVSARDGGIDWTAAAQAQPFDILVVVHTFGQPVDLEPARKLRARHGGFLIEDAAHVLAPAPGIANAGDAVLYSPHKLLPLPEGAVISLSPAAAGWAADLDRALGRPPQAIDDVDWLYKRRLQAAIPDSLRRFLPQGGQADFGSDPSPTTDTTQVLSPSDMARRLLAAIDIAAEARRRRENAEALLTVIRRLDDLRPLFPTVSATPYRLALRAANPQVAAERYAALRQARLPVESWPDLPPKVAADPIHVDGAVALRNTVLLLPVHGALDPDDLARAYRRALR
jgi:hypothetical protein